MKTILLSVAMVAAVGCANLKETQQVDMVMAKVIKIDTVYRYPERLKQITWQDNDEIHYISYVSIHNESYSIGSSIFVMRKR